jgi:hypothetical protein
LRTRRAPRDPIEPPSQPPACSDADFGQDSGVTPVNELKLVIFDCDGDGR